MLPKIFQGSTILSYIQSHTDAHQRLFPLISHWIFRIRGVPLRLDIHETQPEVLAPCWEPTNIMTDGAVGDWLLLGFSHAQRPHLHCKEDLKKMSWSGICTGEVLLSLVQFRKYCPSQIPEWIQERCRSLMNHLGPHASHGHGHFAVSSLWPKS